MDIEKRIEKHRNLEKRLMQALGKENLRQATKEATQIIRKNKMDITPSILMDYFTYLRETIHLQSVFK